MHGLDAVRALAMLLGIVFHAGFAFLPGLPPGTWAIYDPSSSRALSVLLFTSHSFRLSLFFFVAGFFARQAFHRKGLRGFAADRVRRILLPLVVGWVLVYPVLNELWIRGLKKTVGGGPPPPSVEGPPLAGAFPMTHLWFLYYLLVLYVIVLSCRAAIAALDPNESVRRAVDRAVRSAIGTGAAALVLALPSSAFLYSSDGIAWFGIPTPDRSVIPEWSSLVVFGTAVAAGWLVQRQAEVLPAWGRQWPLQLLGALTATALCLAIAGVTPTPSPAPAGELEKLAYAGAYGLATWCWSFAVIGLGMRFIPAANPVVRYLADSSYFIYLAHLPIVVALQLKMGLWPWPWSVKFSLVLAASLTVLLTSYHLLVRSTFIGKTLNGRRYPLAGALTVRRLLRLG